MCSFYQPEHAPADLHWADSAVDGNYLRGFPAECVIPNVLTRVEIVPSGRFQVGAALGDEDSTVIKMAVQPARLMLAFI
jgi:hypothetical protein